jgi:hypothetical protein
VNEIDPRTIEPELPVASQATAGTPRISEYLACTEPGTDKRREVLTVPTKVWRRRSFSMGVNWKHRYI